MHLRLVVTQGISDSTINMLAAIGVSSIVYVATLDSMDISAGTFGAFLGAMVMILAPLRRLTSLNSNIQQGIAAGESIFDLLDAPVEDRGGEHRVNRARGEVRYDQVEFAYEDEKGAVLRDIDLTIGAGETVAFVGRSGSGKTTLVSLLPRFYDASGGRVLLDGVDTREYALDNLRAHIALVSQDVSLFNASIADNIAYGATGEVDRAEIEAVARAAHVTEFVEGLPLGLDTLVGDRGVLLSGGQRQRISIARALLKRAPVLILDEATSALDTHSERHIRAALDDLVRGRTTLVIAHRLSTIENADRIVVLHEGRVVETGSHAELLRRAGHYADLHRLQLTHAASPDADAPDGNAPDGDATEAQLGAS